MNTPYEASTVIRVCPACQSSKITWHMHYKTWGDSIWLCDDCGSKGYNLTNPYGCIYTWGEQKL